MGGYRMDVEEVLGMIALFENVEHKNTLNDKRLGCGMVFVLEAHSAQNRL